MLALIKHIFSKQKTLLLSFIFFFLFSGILSVFATPPDDKYTPGYTLNPTCTPGSTNCTVAVEGLVAAGTTLQYYRGDKTWVTLNTSIVPEGTNQYWTNSRFDTRLLTTTSLPNLATVGTINSGTWNGTMIGDSYISDGITASNYVPLSYMGIASGVATLDGDGKVPTSQLTPFVITDTFVVTNAVDMTGLSSAGTGDVAIVTSESKSYVLASNDYSNITNWIELLAPLDSVLSVNGLTGAVSLTTSEVSEGSNLYFTNSRADARISAQKAQPNGLATLGSNGKVPTSQISSFSLNDTFVVASEAEMLALSSATQGDLAVRTDEGNTYVLADSDPTVLANWVELLTTAAVTSVNGLLGDVSLTTSEVSEGSNLYFTNDLARQAISIASSPLSYSNVTGILNISLADTSTSGYLSATDWNTFNNKQSTVTTGNLTSASNALSVSGGTGAIIGSGVTLTVNDASVTQKGAVNTTTQSFTGAKTFASATTFQATPVFETMSQGSVLFSGSGSTLSQDNANLFWDDSTNRLGIGDTTPLSAFTVGSGDKFQVDSSGNIVKINDVTYSWPSSQGASSTILTNNGSGTLSWSAQTSDDCGSGVCFTVDGSNNMFSGISGGTGTGGALAGGGGSVNFFAGVDTGSSTNDGIANTAVGNSALKLNTIGSSNVAIGNGAFYSNKTGSRAVAIGSSAMYYSNDTVTPFTDYSVAVGYEALRGSTTASANTGNNNTALGYQAGLNITTGGNNTFIGTTAGQANTTGSGNVFTGKNAGYSNTTATGNMFSGFEAGFTNTTGANNTFSGYSTGFFNSSGAGNSFYGYNAGYGNTTGGYNIFSGFQAGISNTVGSNNIFNGSYAGYSNVSGSGATAIGYNAMQYANDTATPFDSENVAVGYEALRGSATASANTGNSNTAIGYQTLRNNTTGYWNTTNGAHALSSNSTGYNNIAIGKNSLTSNTTGNSNTANGTLTLPANTVGVSNTANGYGALFSNVSGSYATAIGTEAMYYANNTSTPFDSGNVAVGYQALRGSTTASANTGNSNTVVGYQAGLVNTTGSTNVFMGNGAGKANTSADDNVFAGYNAGLSNTTGPRNVFIGRSAGSSNSTGDHNTFSGWQAGLANSTGIRNTFYGASAGQLNTTGGSNNFFGYQAGYSNTTGTYNLNLGYLAGYTNSIGNGNIFLGYLAGNDVVDGSNNIIIGYDIDAPIATGAGSTGQLNVGNLIFGTGLSDTGTTVDTDALIGIGTNAPGYRLDVQLTGSDTNIFALTDSDGSCLHNPEAGAETVTCSSDERLKTNITDADNILSYFNSFRIRQYDVLASGDHMMGVIAQEVQMLHPELVKLGPNGFYSVEIPSTWEVVKALQELDLKLSGIQEFTDQTFISRIKDWLGSVSNGLEKIYAGKIETYEIHTDKLCVGSRCITESEFIDLLDRNNIGNNNSSDNSSISETVADTTTDSNTEDGTVVVGTAIDETIQPNDIPVSNEPVVEDLPPQEEPVPEVVPDQNLNPEPEPAPDPIPEVVTE